MFMRSAALLCALAWSSTVLAGGDLHGGPARQRPAPALGVPLEGAQWDLTIFPDGRGLPAGGGTASEGRALYGTRCAACHGPGGHGATADELVGEPQPLDAPYPDKNIRNYWPYATTLFDFIRRAMPMDAPGSLTADEVYALTAYLLFANGIIGENDEMNAATLSRVRMPNREGFDWIDAAPPAEPY